MKTCSLCRHNRRVQHGPHAWLHECAQYAPPLPVVGCEKSGMGLVFDPEAWGVGQDG